MKQLMVELEDRSYPIFIAQDIVDNPELIKPYIFGKQVAIVSNVTVAPLYLEKVQKAFTDFDCSCIILPDGEEYKTLEGINPVLDKLMTDKLDRRLTLVALGGGVIGDMTGFCAAIYRRGVNFIQIPTTLLAQVDSSVGGKTGVNHPLGKNMIGAFYQPHCVVIDTNVLDTLDDRQLSAGIAEIIKYALIEDAEFFVWLENNMDQLLLRDPVTLAYAIEVSCKSKAQIVAEDEREAGKRALLNLGHTFGHAIETASGYGTYLHGEAVAIGMLMAAKLSADHDWLDNKSVSRIKKLLEQAHLPVSPPAGLDVDKFLALMAGDKKVLDGILHLVLLTAIGAAIVTQNFEYELLKKLLLRSLSSD